MRRRSKISLLLLAPLIVAISATYVVLQLFSIDNYDGLPQVVGLPSGFDPLAKTEPYSGAHPSTKNREPDTYPYPIPIGTVGPVTPTYADSLDYPFVCRTEASGLGQPLPDNQEGAGIVVYDVNETGETTNKIIGYSKDCSLSTRVVYYYLSRESGVFASYTGVEKDVEVLKLNNQPVPFVVRLEIGTINRHIYVIATLRGDDDTPEKPDLRYWNRKLVYQLAGGVGIGRRQGRIPPDYIPDRRQQELRQGYAIAFSSANQTSTSYDIELAEDTLARVKRQFIARYGEPLYTIGIGGSGGAIQQYLIGQNRPGLLDAGIAMYSYPDMVTQTTRILDCELLEYFFDVVDADNPKWKNWSQRRWIEGFNASDNAPDKIDQWQVLQSIRQGNWPQWLQGQTECTRSWRNLAPQVTNPEYTYFASLFAPEILSRVPWTYWDNLKRVFGTDDDGYARRTYDNVGVQYGLHALKRGEIEPAEFIRLNESIGGWKRAADMTPERYWLFKAGRSSLADLSVWSHHNMNLKTSEKLPARRSVGDVQAIAAAYRSGQVFLGHLSMPIIDYRHYLEPELDMHHSLQSVSARLRMQRRQGHVDNQLIWSAKRPGNQIPVALDLLDEWLSNMHENSELSATEARPARADDRCYDDEGNILARGDNVWDGSWNNQTDGACMRKYPIFSNPRIEAGDDYAGDIFKCHLQSIDTAIANNIYAPVDMSAYRSTLQSIFSDGVCDYSLGDVGKPPEYP